jgi:3-phenylpropionate/cinnamic acid dioxygenase small subunit
VSGWSADPPPRLETATAASAGPELAAADRAEIGDLLARYCFALDGRDWEALRDVFAADARITYSGGRVSTGIDQIVTFMRTTASAVAVTQHLLHTSLVWATGPDTAAGRTHVTAHHVGYDVTLPAAETLTFTVTGTYNDRFTRTPAGWRISGRTLTLLTSAGDPAILGSPPKTRSDR